MEVHHKMLSDATIHEPSPEVKTPLEIRDYILQFNKMIDAINNISGKGNPTAPKINKIII